MYQIKSFALKDVIFKITCPECFVSAKEISNTNMWSVNSRTYSNNSNRKKYLISFNIHFVNSYLCSLNAESCRRIFLVKSFKVKKSTKTYILQKQQGSLFGSVSVKVTDEINELDSHPLYPRRKIEGTHDQTVSKLLTVWRNIIFRLKS